MLSLNWIYGGYLKKVLQAKLQYAFSDALGWGQNYSDFLQAKKKYFQKLN